MQIQKVPPPPEHANNFLAEYFFGFFFLKSGFLYEFPHRIHCSKKIARSYRKKVICPFRGGKFLTTERQHIETTVQGAQVYMEPTLPLQGQHRNCQ